MRTLLPLIALSAACAQAPEEVPLAGPGFAEDSGAFLGEAARYLVGLTHLQVKNQPGPGGRFGEHADAVGNHLFEEEPEGWLGAGFRNVGRLQWWTMTVWEDEDALLQFVVSEPHLSAMVDIDEVSAGAVSRSLWLDRDQLPLAWPDALELLAEAQDSTYGDPSWP